ncbi:TauD/TfdA family dioxygenase [Oxalobacteraceae bacterium CAVE-383]|nr:TauD/TfdA family dioxygenase [Oxalobacteraceae bacterium CAVE-383]
MTITVTPLAAALGASIEGLDAAHITPEDAQALHEAFLKHHVLVVHGPQISEEQLIEFGKCFGTIENARKKSVLASHPEIMVISNIRENGETVGSLPDGELTFHFDRIHQKVPNKAGVLHAIEIPTKGGDTCFADMTLAYDTLPEATKKKLEGLSALNTYEYGQTHTENKKLSEEAPTAVHPVVRTIPETGRKALYICRLMTDRILGLPDDESRALLDELCDHVENQKFVYAHHWKVGDILVWDNRCTIHAREDFDGSQRRLLKRVTVGDTTPPVH